MEPALIAWLLVIVVPLGLTYAATIAWRELDQRAIGRIRTLLKNARAKSDAARAEMHVLLQDAQVSLEQKTLEIHRLKTTVDAQSPALRAAVARAPRESHDELANNVDVWFTREEVERRARRAEIKARVELLEKTWFHSTSDENACSELLCENIWLFEPDLVSVGHVFCNRGLETIARAYFPGGRTTNEPKFLDTSRRADVAGVFYRNDMMTTGAENPERVLVIIEAKAVNMPITALHMDEAFQYGLNLRKLIPALTDWNIECYALGGSIAEGVHRQHFRVGAGPHALTVTPITWSFLLQRAKSLDPTRVVARKIDVNGPCPPNFLSANSAPSSETFSGAQTLTSQIAQQRF